MISKWNWPVLQHSVYDGDTVKIEADVGLYFRANVSVRISGTDTPEVRPRKSLKEHALHKEAGFAVKAVTAAWLSHVDPDNLMVASIARDKYAGRIVGDFFDFHEPDQTLSAFLLYFRLALPYEGQKKKFWTKKALTETLKQAHLILNEGMQHYAPR